MGGMTGGLCFRASLKTMRHAEGLCWLRYISIRDTKVWDEEGEGENQT